LKNASVRIFVVKITVLAYLELIRQLVHVPHRTSITLSVFTMTLTAGMMGASPQRIFFSELIVFKNANLHIFGLAITVFANFESLGKLIEAPHGTSTTFSVISMTSTVGSLGTNPQKKCFSELTTFKNANLCNFGLNIKVLAFF